MTSRPPTLREKRRYVLVQIDPGNIPLDQKELYFAVLEAVTSLWGDAAGAFVHPAVVVIEGSFAVLRCRRGTERELAIALSCITSCSGQRIVLHTVATSGTIESLRERMAMMKISDNEDVQLVECTFNGHLCTVCKCTGQKIDVIEKGFKNTTRFFLTKEDLEN